MCKRGGRGVIMQITLLKQKGKSEEYYIELDGEKKGTLQLETIYKHHLKEGKELDEQELKSINAGEKGSLLYWLGRIAGELVYTHQHNPGFGDALVMSLH